MSAAVSVATASREHAKAVAVRSIDDEDIDASLHQSAARQSGAALWMTKINTRRSPNNPGCWCIGDALVLRSQWCGKTDWLTAKNHGAFGGLVNTG